MVSFITDLTQQSVHSSSCLNEWSVPLCVFRSDFAAGGCWRWWSGGGSYRHLHHPLSEKHHCLSLQETEHPELDNHYRGFNVCQLQLKIWMLGSELSSKHLLHSKFFFILMIICVVICMIKASHHICFSWQKVTPSTCGISGTTLVDGLAVKVEIGTDGSVFVVNRGGEVFQR